MTKDRKSVHISATAHSLMLLEFEQMQKKAQKNADYAVNPPNIEEFVSEAIFEKIERMNRK